MSRCIIPVIVIYQVPQPCEALGIKATETHISPEGELQWKHFNHTCVTNSSRIWQLWLVLIKTITVSALCFKANKLFLRGETERNTEDSTSLSRELVSTTAWHVLSCCNVVTHQKALLPALLPRAQGLISQVNHPYYTYECSKRGKDLSFAFYKAWSCPKLGLLCSLVPTAALQPGAQI